MRCEYCQKKLQLAQTITGKCKCNKIFCIIHRLSETHNCCFDYKSEMLNAEQLLQNKCVAPKIIKI
jgi:AN1-type zinc finger and ubiquitin domain-containing protein 1